MFFYTKNDQETGPISLDELKKLVFARKIQEKTLIRRDASLERSTNSTSDADRSETDATSKTAAINVPELAAAFESNRIPARLGLSLLGLIFCFPAGVLALIFGIKVNQWKYRGDFDKARNYSRWAALASIVGILGTLLVFFSLPQFSSAREAARRMQCTNNLKMILLALHSYHDDFGALPPAYTTDANGKPLHSWRVLLLPYLEQSELYEQIRLDEPWDSEWNSQFHAKRIDGRFVCPSAIGSLQKLEKKEAICGDDSGLCSYSVVVGDETPFPPDGKSISFGQVTSGPSNTIAVVERKLPVCWMDPNDGVPFQTAKKGVNQSWLGVGSLHSGGCDCGILDGSVRFVSQTIEPDVWNVLLTTQTPFEQSPKESQNPEDSEQDLKQ